jgi:Ca2+-binding RTX toxin-like protein
MKSRTRKNIPHGPQLLEELEQRRLLAGITLMAHGLNGTVNGWIRAAASAIQQRLGGDSAASRYVMKVDKQGGDLKVVSFAPEDGQRPFNETSESELLIKLDWSKVSSFDTKTQDVAKVVGDYLLSASNTVAPLASLPIHLIGHSRGGSLVSELSRRLGRRGVWVDQVTFLDATGGVEVFGQTFGDAVLKSYNNVIFTDSYWRENSNPIDPNGTRVDGSYNGDLNGVVDGAFSEHNAVTGYYHGTIDLSARNNIDNTISSDWYRGTEQRPARDKVGFVFARLGGSARPTSGLGRDWGGESGRSSAGKDGTQFPNLEGLRALKTTKYAAGQSIPLTFRYNDRDSAANIWIYLDRDRNPFNTNNGRTLAKFSVEKQEQPTAARRNGGTTGVAAGRYFIGARIIDASGNFRFLYSTQRLTISDPVPPPAPIPFASVESGVLTARGDQGNDQFRLRVNDEQVLISRNGFEMVFPRTDVSGISILMEGGNDGLFVESTHVGVYAYGGNGNDSIYGSSLNDTLVGGNGNDRMDGGAGDDKLVGNNGNDTIYGGPGADRIFGDEGDDRIFGADGSIDWIDGGEGYDIVSGDAELDIVSSAERTA